MCIKNLDKLNVTDVNHLTIMISRLLIVTMNIATLARCSASTAPINRKSKLIGTYADFVS